MIAFKKGPKPTGLAAVGHPYAETSVLAKRGGGKVGIIIPPSATNLGGEREWKVGVMVETEPTPEAPCPWRWVFFKSRFGTEPQAREWLKQQWSAISLRFRIHEQED